MSEKGDMCMERNKTIKEINKRLRHLRLKCVSSCVAGMVRIYPDNKIMFTSTDLNGIYKLKLLDFCGVSYDDTKGIYALCDLNG